MFQLRKLEDRIVLDGAALIDAQDHFQDQADLAEHSQDTADAQTHEGFDVHEPLTVDGLASGADDAGVHVLVVSSDISDADDLVAAAKDNVIVVTYDAELSSLEDLAGQIADALGGEQADTIAFASHGSGSEGIELVQSETINTDSLASDSEQQAFWAAIGEQVREDGRIDLLACDIVSTDSGADLVAAIETLSGTKVAASSDATGNEAYGGDWVLESDGVDVQSTYFDADALEGFDGSMGETTIGGDVSGSGDEDHDITGTMTAADDDGVADGTVFSVSTNASHGEAVINAESGLWTYTPNGNYYTEDGAPDSFTVTVTDDGGNTTTQDVTITVESVNDAPTSNGAVSIGALVEDATSTTLTGDADTLLVNISDVESDTCALVAGTYAGTYGSMVIADDGSWTYALDNTDADTDALSASVAATESFTVNVSDGTGTGDQTVTVSLTGANDAPTADSKTVTTNEDTAYTFSAADFNFSDVDDADGLSSVQITGLESVGDLTLSGVAVGENDIISEADIEAGLLTFTPAQDANGSGYDSFTFTVNDGAADSAESYTMTMNVTAANDAPTITGDLSGSGDEDGGAITGTMSAVDADGLTDGSIFTVSTDGADGSATIDAATGAWSYTPYPNTYMAYEYYEGYTPDTFTVTVTDDDGNTETQVVTITVNSVVDLTVGEDTAATNEDTPVSGNLSTNDSTTSGGTLEYYCDATIPSNGILTFPGNGSYTYTPNANFNGQDSFIYQVYDPSSDESAVKTVVITVESVNDAPSFTVGPNQTVQEDAGAQTVNGFATAISAGPDDESGDMLLFNVSTNNDDAFATDAGPAIDASGNLTYTLADNFNGDVTVTVSLSDDGGTANDGIDTSSTQEFTITVEPVNDAPTAASNTVISNEDTAYTFSVADFNFADVDVADGLSSVQITGLESVGDLTLSGVAVGENDVISEADIEAGLLTFTPAQNANGSGYDSFTFTVNDGAADSVASYTMTMNVTAVNDAPTITVGTDDSDAVTYSTGVSDTGGDFANVSELEANGGTVSGSLSQWNTDYFRIDVVTPGTLTIIIDGGDSYLSGSLIDNSTGGCTIAGNGKDFSLEVTAEKPGTWTLYVSLSHTASSGSYNMSSEFTASLYGGKLTLGDVEQSDTVSVVKGDSVIFSDTSTTEGMPSETALLGMLTLSNDSLDATQTSTAMTWSFDPGTEDFGYLADGEHLDLIYTLTATDSQGASSAATTVTVTINGSNERPEITIGASNDVTEDFTENGEALSTTGSMTVSDLDYSNTVTAKCIEVFVAGEPLSESDSDMKTTLFDMLDLTDSNIIGADATTGTVNWSFNSGDEHFDYLAAGETLTLTYSVQALDSYGGLASQEVTVTITGTNDTPVIVGGESAAVTIEENTTAVTEVSASDVDTSNVLTYSISGGDDASLFSITSGTGVLTFKAAPDCETPKDVGGNNIYDVVVQVADGDGGIATQTLAVTVADVNDESPVFTSSTAPSVAENTTSVVALGSTDADAGDSVTYTLTGGADQALFQIVDGELQFQSAPDFESPGDAGEDNGYNVEVTATDGAGNATGQNISVSVTGANDVAVFGTGVGVDSLTVTEDVATDLAGGNLIGEGTLTFTDADAADADNTFIAQPATVGTYGTFTISDAGEWTYTADNTSVAVQSLGAGDSLTDTFSVASGDGSTHDVVVTINGANDTASISGTSTGAITETDATQSISGSLSVADVDSSENVFTPQTGTAGTNGYGTFSINADGGWTYTMDTAHNEFVAGQDYTDSFTVASVDGTDTQVVTVTLSGTNDAAVISGMNTGSITETDAAQSTSGSLSVADVDSAVSTFTAQTDVAGDNGYGTFTIDTAGVWTYIMGSAHDELVAGVEYTDSFTVASADGSASQAVSVTLTGGNDTASISGTSTGAITETDAIQSISGSLSVADVDSGENIFAVQTDVAGANGYGTFSIDADGAWTYSMNSAHNEFVAGQDYTDSFTVASVDGTDTQVVTVSLSGTNDAAVISGTNTGAITETDAVQSTSGSLTVLDVDSVAVSTFAVQTDAAGDNGYGKFSINAAGVWTYTMDSAHDEFVNCGAYTDSFTVATADGIASQVVTVTITGTDDVPQDISEEFIPDNNETGTQLDTSSSWETSVDTSFSAPLGFIEANEVLSSGGIVLPEISGSGSGISVLEMGGTNSLLSGESDSSLGFANRLLDQFSSDGFWGEEEWGALLEEDGAL